MFQLGSIYLSMGRYTDKLYKNIKHNLSGSGWSGMRYLGIDVNGIHLVMPEGMEMSEPFQERIWNLLKDLPDIDEPVETVYMSIRKHGWTHYYQTPINPSGVDFLTVGMNAETWTTKPDWEMRVRTNTLSREDVVINEAQTNHHPIGTSRLYIDPELFTQIFQGLDVNESDKKEVDDKPDPDQIRKRMRRI